MTGLLGKELSIMHEPLGPIQRLSLDDPLFSIRGMFYRYPDDTQALSGIEYVPPLTNSWFKLNHKKTFNS